MVSIIWIDGAVVRVVSFELDRFGEETVSSCLYHFV